MNPIQSKIENITSSALFQEFVSTYLFDYAVEDFHLFLRNECYYCEIYLEYGYPSFYIFSLKHNSFASEQEAIDFDNKKIRTFDQNFTNSLQGCEDIIENRDALVRLYRYFKLFITFYPDFFSCSSCEKYKNKFRPKELAFFWPKSFDLPKKKEDKDGFDFWGMIKKVF